MTDAGKEKEIIKEEEWNINTPGILVHGIERTRAETLRAIFSEGLVPLVEQKSPSKDENITISRHPDHISLSMVGKGMDGYKSTFTCKGGYGANEDYYYYNLTLVIDPDYVKTHLDEFVAVGFQLAPDDIIRKHFYQDLSGNLFNNIKYKTPRHFDVSPDEVLVRYLPSEAIVGVITTKTRLEQVKEDLRKACPERKIRLFDSEGNEYTY